MKIKMISLFALSAGTIAYWLATKEPLQTPEVELVSSHTDTEMLQTTISQHKAHSIGPPSDIKDPQIINGASLWKSADGNTHPTTYEKADLLLTPDLIDGLQKGGMINIPIPQLKSSFEVTIEEANIHKNGDKTIVGFLDDNPSYSMTLTQGKNITFANISTPYGVYLMEARDNKGWIVSKDAVAEPYPQETDEVLVIQDVLEPSQ